MRTLGLHFSQRAVKLLTKVNFFFFFCKIPDLLFKMHYRLREKSDGLEKCELVPEQK